MKAIITIAMLIAALFSATKEKNANILKYGIYADRLTTNELLPDPKDLVFYEVCMAKREEDSMLVTGNMKHFPAKPFIVTPNELLEIISKNV